MKIGVLVFPGSNCDHDAYYSIKHVIGVNTEFLFHKEHDLKGVDAVIVPGGFSYGDYLRCGAIARFSPMMQTVTTFAEKGGMVFAVCNGFQILCESGLLPGVLLRNAQQQFVCKNVYIKENGSEKNPVLKIPVAHGEGRYFTSAKMLEELEKNQQVIYRYCDENGGMTGESNPNGTLSHIAGICNTNRNVFGMMPHPERACSSLLNNIDGKTVFNSLFGIC